MLHLLQVFFLLWVELKRILQNSSSIVLETTNFLKSIFILLAIAEKGTIWMVLWLLYPPMHERIFIASFSVVWCTAVNPKLSLRLNIQTVWGYCCLFLINEAYNLFQTLGMTKNWRNLGKIKICFSFSQLTSMHDHFVYLQVFAEYITILRIKILFKRLIAFEIACFNINFKRNGLFLDYARKCDVLQSFKHLYIHTMCIGLVILDFRTICREVSSWFLMKI